MKKIIIGIAMFCSVSAFADAIGVRAYDGMIHATITGEAGSAAEVFFNSIKKPAYDNGAALVKILNDDISCSKTKASGIYQCDIDTLDGSGENP